HPARAGRARPAWSTLPRSGIRVPPGTKRLHTLCDLRVHCAVRGDGAISGEPQGRGEASPPRVRSGMAIEFASTGVPMKKLVLILAVVCASCTGQAAADKNAASLETQAQRVTIIRDTWGIPHVYGKTDADAVFGVAYAQAEDDFNRVETNFINSQGRLAEAEGEGEIYRDLRMKIFIDPNDMKAQYEKSPAWLKALMNGWADGLNYYLAKHPQVKPRVLTRFEPWMALSFSEGSIGGDIEKVNLTQLEAFYGKGSKKEATQAAAELPIYVEPTGSNGAAVAPSNTTTHHA